MARPGFRFIPLLGALFVLLVVIGFVVAGDTPDADGSAAAIRGDYDSEAKHQIGAYLVALGAASLLFFAGYWRSVLKAIHPTGRMTASVALAGATVAATGLAVMSLIHAALTEAAQKSQISDQALQALNVLDSWSFYPFAVGFSIFALASGLALVRGRGFLPSWLGWLAVALGVLGMIPFTGFFANAATGIWVIVLSVMLFLRREAVETLRGDGGRHMDSPSAVA